tara:strand:+ start:138 stop:350 length:213 start_codon:yes stop_codon:yes gene_type:complete
VVRVRVRVRVRLWAWPHGSGEVNSVPASRRHAAELARAVERVEELLVPLEAEALELLLVRVRVRGRVRVR